MNGVGSVSPNVATQISNFTLKQSIDLNAEKTAQILNSAPKVSNGSTGHKVDIIA